MDIVESALVQSVLFLILPLVVCALTLLPLVAIIAVARRLQERRLQRALKELEDSDDET